jgi:hypothetical protein
LAALSRLDRESRRLERTATGPSFEKFVTDERASSHTYGGRTVFGFEPDPRAAAAQPD